MREKSCRVRGKGGIFALQTAAAHHSHKQSMLWPNPVVCSVPNLAYSLCFAILSPEHMFLKSLLVLQALAQASSFWNPFLSIPQESERLSPVFPTACWEMSTETPLRHTVPSSTVRGMCLFYLLLPPQQLARGLVLNR